MIDTKALAAAFKTTLLLATCLLGCEPPTVQHPQEEPRKPESVETARKTSLSAPVQAALQRLTAYLLPPSEQGAVEAILATVEPSEQLEYMGIVERVLADEAYRDVPAEQRVQTMGLLAMSMQDARPSVASALTEVIPPTAPELRGKALVLAELAPCHRIAETLRLIGQMIADQGEATRPLMLRRLLNGAERERRARLLKMLWLNEDGGEAHESWGEPLGDLVTGALGVERLTVSLDRLLALPSKERWVAAQGLTSLGRPVADRAKVDRRLDVILAGTDAEFILMTHDLAYLFPAHSSPEAVEAFMQLKEEGQAWRLLVFTLRKYKAEPEALYVLAALPAEEQVACLDKAVRCYLDLGIPITAARLRANATP